MWAKKLFLLALTVCVTYAEVQLITEAKPGEEYVYLHTSAAGSRPVERKEKASENGEHVFETAHKLPPSITYALKDSLDSDDDNSHQALVKSKSPKKREAAEPAAPAPAGAIKLDVRQLLEQYKTELKTSTTTTSRPKSNNNKAARSRSTKKPTTTTTTTESSPSRGRRIGSGRRMKKEAQNDQDLIATSPNPILTTDKTLKRFNDDDLDEGAFLASGSEKQRSRIQIKKGPNGQEYEYEYVYYYYDDEDEKKDTPVVNGHDGPAKETIEQQIPSRTKSSPEPAVNEVVPSRGRPRGRQLEDEEVGEERLPANTRFPPRSRNLNTTPTSSAEPEEVKRNQDSQSDETQGNRGRTRANVRRPSLDLVDNASFNTHTPSGNGPSFPSDLPAGPVRFLGATPNERVDIPTTNQDGKEVQQQLTIEEDSRTVMSPMDKVALDLYAILQGTQKLSGEELGTGNDTDSTESSEEETTTMEITTEIPTTEATTPTTTTTTTTTTQAPSTTEVAAFGKGTRYRGRPGLTRKPSVSSSGSSGSSTEQPQDTTKKNRFNRPSFGTRPRSRPTTAPSENNEEITKEEAKPVQAPTRTRGRFGASRNKFTTSTTESSSGDSSSTSATSRPSLRARPTFNVRGRTKPAAQTTTDGENAPSEGAHEDPSTTARSRARISAGGNVKPLRPGPRISLGGRSRFSTTAAPDTPAEPAPVVEEDQESAKTEEQEQKEPEPATHADSSNPLTRLRNRQRQPLPVRAKASASNTVPVRRTNPLLARRKNPNSTEAPSSEAPQEIVTEVSIAEEEVASTDPAPSSTTTTEEPKGLNRLLAGRRRLNLRTPGTIA